MSKCSLWLPVALMTALASGLPADEDLDELFAVRLVKPADAVAREVRARVQVYKPYGFEPIPGAPVKAELDFGEEVLSFAGVTDENGEVEIVLALSPEILPREYGSTVELTATASYRGVAREVSSYLYFEGEPRAVVSTDKKMYQPGQTLHIRALWLDASRFPMTDEEVEFTISEPSGRDVAAAELTTSPFGITSFDWQIPATAQPGDYEIYAASELAEGLTRVRIAPYSLPSFQVTATPSEPFYLPGDEATVEVEAKTLDGAGLAEVEVDVHDQDDLIRSTGPARTGEDGRAVLRLDMTDAFEELDPEYYRAYVDLQLGVSAADPVSGRTEHGKLWLRLSVLPIHVYAFGTLPDEGQPGQAYVTTAYADGRPASCTVELWQRDDELLLGSFETGPLGVARVPDEVLPQRPPGGIEGGDLQYRELRIVARDGDGGRGITDGDPWGGAPWDEAPWLLIDSPRTLLRPGEPLRVTLHPFGPMERVLVEVLRDGERLDSRLLLRLDGPTPLDFDSRPEYAGKITVAAYSLSPNAGRHEVTSPRPTPRPWPRSCTATASISRPCAIPGARRTAPGSRWSTISAGCRSGRRAAIGSGTPSTTSASSPNPGATPSVWDVRSTGR